MTALTYSLIIIAALALIYVADVVRGRSKAKRNMDWRP